MAIADVSIALASEGIKHKIVVAAASTVYTEAEEAVISEIVDNNPPFDKLVRRYGEDMLQGFLKDKLISVDEEGDTRATKKGLVKLRVTFTRSARKNARATRKAWNAKAAAGSDKITELNEEQFDVVAFAADHEPSVGDLIKRFGSEIVTALLNERVLIRSRGKVYVTAAGNKLVQKYTKAKTASVRSARNKG